MRPICRRRCTAYRVCSPCPPPSRPGWDQEVHQGIMLADAAKQAGIAQYVYTSVGSAHRNTGIPHFETKWKVEQHIRQIGLPATVLRPVFFMENFTTYIKPSAEGILMMPMRTDKRLAMVALRDICLRCGGLPAAERVSRAGHRSGGRRTDDTGSRGAPFESYWPVDPVPGASPGAGRSCNGTRRRHDVPLVQRCRIPNRCRSPEADIQDSAHHLYRVGEDGRLDEGMNKGQEARDQNQFILNMLLAPILPLDYRSF